MRRRHEVKLWTCPKCGRQFERRMQVHSCRAFPLESHFEGKPKGRRLYEKFSQILKRSIGSFKVESLECCIHFVSTFTFAAVKILKDKIRVDFSLSREIKSHRINRSYKMSANRYLHVVDLINEKAIDEELMEWVEEARDIKMSVKEV